MNVEPLIAWVVAREELRKRKEANPYSGFGELPVWTDDPILRTYRFCNVRRRDDRVSRWLRKHVLTTQNLAQGCPNFLMFTAFCRWNNWPPVIAEIMRQGLYPAKRMQWKRIAGVVDQFKDADKKAWTGAYMINAKGCEKGQSKAEFIARQVIQRGLGKALPKIEVALETRSRREVWLVVNGLMNWGAFMAGQWIDDLGWTPLLAGATDTYTWAPQGPGSIRGLNRLLGLPLKTRHAEDEWCGMLVTCREAIIQRLGPEYEDLTLMDCQNALCETDKWLRVKHGEGRPKSVYRPEGAY